MRYKFFCSYSTSTLRNEAIKPKFKHLISSLKIIPCSVNRPNNQFLLFELVHAFIRKRVMKKGVQKANILRKSQDSSSNVQFHCLPKIDITYKFEFARLTKKGNL